jgi:3-hydroxyacyl-[acyl-carrier-protein] dehydratase
VKPIGQFVVATDDACLDGHFPARPVVPGVVLLEEVVALLRDRLSCDAPIEIVISKFTGAVLPEQPVDVSCGDPRGGVVRFSCSVAGRAVANGAFRVTGDPP